MWQPGDGGELVLWPFLEGKVTVAPRMDRVVHRVQSSIKERFCFTIWMDGTAVNSDEDTLLSREHLQFESFDHAAHFFRFSPLQRVISRAVFADEYEDSLRECVGGTAGERPMIRHHQATVTALEGKLLPLITSFREKKQNLDPALNISVL